MTCIPPCSPEALPLSIYQHVSTHPCSCFYSRWLITSALTNHLTPVKQASNAMPTAGEVSKASKPSKPTCSNVMLHVHMHMYVTKFGRRGHLHCKVTYVDAIYASDTVIVVIDNFHPSHDYLSPQHSYLQSIPLTTTYAITSWTCLPFDYPYPL